MAIISANGSSRSGVGSGRSRRLVIIANASTATDLSPAVSGQATSIVSGWLHFGSACAWEIKSGGVSLLYGRVTAGATIGIQPSDDVVSQSSQAIQIETSVASTVDGMIDLG